MSAQMVEVIQKDYAAKLRKERSGMYGYGLSEEDKCYWAAAVDKRTRSKRDGSEDGDVLGQEASVGQKMRREGPTYAIPSVQESENRAEPLPTFAYRSMADLTLNVPNNFPINPPTPKQGITPGLSGLSTDAPVQLMQQLPIPPQG